MGIGSTIYFRQLKFYSILFFTFSVLSIPSLAFYANSTSVSGENPFFRFSLGNLGNTNVPCISKKIDRATSMQEIELHCKTGKINSLIDVGLATEKSLCPVTSADAPLSL